MIWYYIITFFDQLFSSVLETFGIPRVTELPLGMDQAVADGVGYFKTFMEIFPPIAIIFQAFMVYMAFRLTLLILKNIPLFKINV